MKRFFYLVTLITSVCFFYSCAEEDPALGVSVDETFTNKATIEGYAYLSTNKSSTEAVKYAPEGTLLSFTINYGGNNGLGVPASNGRYVKTTTVGANGRYAIELPARADGAAVTVEISGAQVLLTVTTDDGKSKDQVFGLVPSSQDIISDFTYLKKLEYREESVLQSSETWKDGTYQVKLEYYDGTRYLPVPRDTEVKVTVAGNQFIPVRTNDWVFIKKIGSNGLLELKLAAPALSNGGLAFTWDLVFVAEAITREEYDESRNQWVSIYNDYVFRVQKMALVYGGRTVEGEDLIIMRSEQLTFK
ncbi:MAG: hypothetical protein LBH61_07745 [Dysgonamonadaceae bacterium]|jgi:hypothetical protein|nr:hypothetical protein [Dysgonamonadaceae bacterium]